MWQTAMPFTMPFITSPHSHSPLKTVGLEGITEGSVPISESRRQGHQAGCVSLTLVYRYSGLPGFEWPSESYFTSRCLCFLICKKGRRAVLPEGLL